MTTDVTPADWRGRLHEVIFEADTRAGKVFDIALLACIGLSVLAVCLESVRAIRIQYGAELRWAEWVFTTLFAVEYILRLVSVRRPWRYAVSFYGIVDLLAILPTYASVFVEGTQSLLVIRALRLLRVFRVLKLAQFVTEARMLRAALLASSRKILIFLGAVLVVMLIAGAAMYLIEGEENGFTSIPRGIYWAVVTMTTVGYGDLTPHTVAGQVLSSLLMILGYGIIAVPTGIVSVSMAQTLRDATHTQACPDCGRDGHANDAEFCKYCGAKLY
ncbi:MAG: ion transporter [Verrucomicrobia bacterium]|nr:MAG: ion transporter [Verrucomicrobiota bacterium]